MTATGLDALDAIPPALIPAAIVRLAARAMEPPPPAPEPADDALLTPDEVAALLKADRRFVYRHARELGGIRLSRRKLRFREARVRRYVESRR